jgi:hypothetical protein
VLSAAGKHNLRPRAILAAIQYAFITEKLDPISKE